MLFKDCSLLMKKTTQTILYFFYNLLEGILILFHFLIVPNLVLMQATYNANNNKKPSLNKIIPLPLKLQILK